jgi:hypothetical protein
MTKWALKNRVRMILTAGADAPLQYGDKITFAEFQRAGVSQGGAETLAPTH